MPNDSCMIHQQEVAILVSFLFTMSGKIDKLKKIFYERFRPKDSTYIIIYMKVNVHFEAQSQFIFPFFKSKDYRVIFFSRCRRRFGRYFFRICYSANFKVK